MSKGTIMIVDDTIYMRTLLKKILESDGYEVIAEAEDGIDALKFYNKFHPDLVTLDISMPFTNGFNVLAKIKAINPEAKVIMISSSGHKKNIIDAADLGVNHFIVKPFSPEKVLETVSLVMEKEYIPKAMENINLEALDLKDYVSHSDVIAILASETGLDNEDAQDILNRFLEKLPEIEKALDESFIKKDYEEISNLAHKLRGALLNIRFRKFSEVAEHLEENSRDKNESLMENYYKILKEWLVKIRNLPKAGGK